jgi:FMN-dependent oxidoreductase (nitrilotriacetate monooxygenase family)
MEVVLGHWRSWADDALIVDKASGRFADGARVQRLDYQGEFFRSRGPFTVPRSAQGQPVVIQAGQSGRGRRFAGRWGEVVFAMAPTLELGQQGYAALRAEAEAAGRDPDTLRICNLVTPVCAATKAEAEDKMALSQKLALDIDQLSLLSEALNFDFASRGMDEPLSDADLASVSGLQSIRDRVLALSSRSNPTVREFMDLSHRGRPDDAIVGGPREVADALEEQFAGRACDGFVIAATHVPGAYADFVEHVVPELQRRGVFHTDYAGATLRENLGLPQSA